MIEQSLSEITMQSEEEEHVVLKAESYILRLSEADKTVAT